MFCWGWAWVVVFSILLCSSWNICSPTLLATLPQECTLTSLTRSTVLAEDMVGTREEMYDDERVSRFSLAMVNSVIQEFAQ